MTIHKKDSVPTNQIEEACRRARRLLLNNPLGMEVLQRAEDAAEALFQESIDNRLERHERICSTVDRKELEGRLYTVFGIAVTEYRLAAFKRTHDIEGNLLDERAWRSHCQVLERFLPEGGRSRIASGGRLLVDQCRFFVLAAVDTLPDGAAITAPLSNLADKYEALVDERSQAGLRRQAAREQLEARRAEVQRMRRATYYFLKFMQAWEADFDLDADEIFFNAKKAAAKKKAAKEAREAKKAEPEAPEIEVERAEPEPEVAEAAAEIGPGPSTSDGKPPRPEMEDREVPQGQAGVRGRTGSPDKGEEPPREASG